MAINPKSFEIIKRLKSLRNQKNIDGMARFGISPTNTLGVPIPVLRSIAKKTGKNHEVALELWQSGIHEARILASMMADPEKLGKQTAQEWIADFDSWDVCDQSCSNLLDKADYAFALAYECIKSEKEFIRRTGFVLFATSAVHNKQAADSVFEDFFPSIVKYSTDNRNFVKKAVNWALRQIGKRNLRLNKQAVKLAAKLAKSSSASARWIGKDAWRELTSKKIIDFIKLRRDKKTMREKSE